ncbi:MAG: acetyl/propionyl/methylcrotonyl-CoA carboxylase subunit alpha [Betaproteobacteria bacterium]
MFKRILIANRGEIACRVAATARRLGIETVAVYSDADARSAHVQACDEAYRLGPAPARESYLRGDLILDIAKASGAQAVHPGYGFLSENEGFARKVGESGLVFIGPPPEAIAAMGSKAAAKSLMERAGVPLVPGYHGERQESDYLRGQADAIGYPVLIKASAGGGGKGMRIVERSEDFAAALASCRREALAAFGSDEVIIEHYLRRPRHIEVQIFADRHGNCVHLFERDCSVQRRHQKVVEEAPAPGMTEARRREMGDAAISAARAVGYEGAGTVEFIAEQDGRFFFMVMNTRFQVEHPVTEMITGLDLVEWQLRVAAGEPLPAAQSALAMTGHAIEVRLYAENPERGFLPSTGLVRVMHGPAAVNFQTGAAGSDRVAAVRLDSGVRAGDTISAHYDPMIAKLIAWGADRNEARARLAQALAGMVVVGPSTNAAFLYRLMHNAAFAAADLDTGLIEREGDVLVGAALTVAAEDWALAAAAWLAVEEAESIRERAGHPQAAGTAPFSPIPDRWEDPWVAMDSWRVHGAGSRWLRLSLGEARAELRIEPAREGRGFTVYNGEEVICLADLRWDRATAALSGLVGSRTIACRAVVQPGGVHVFLPGRHLRFVVHAPGEDSSDEAGHAGGLTAPMPGKVLAMMVGLGAVVERGQPLAVLEAMKMEHLIVAPSAGRISAIMYPVGSQVQEGAALLAIEPVAP